MNVLVTGATGFIGNYVIDYLLKSDKSISITATSKSLEKAKCFTWFDSLNYVPYDINLYSTNYRGLFVQQDMVIHLAWQGLPNYEDLFHFEDNLWAHYFFLKNAINSGVKKIVVIGTCFEYGNYNGALNENLVTNPSNAYGLAKDTLRKFIVELKKQNDFSFNWIRLFYLYGQGQNEKSFFSQLKNSLEKGDDVFNMSGGEQLRDYLPVETVAEYIAKISLQRRYEGTVNCCSGTPVSIRSLAEKFVLESKNKIRLNFGFYPYPDYEPMSFWGDNSLLKKVIANDK